MSTSRTEGETTGAGIEPLYARLDERRTKDDQRSRSQRDRDRLLYASAFRRLAGVTQVVGAAEGHIFHNRLTHTLEVAQIARRIAERFAEGPLPPGGRRPDPEAAEAAALAHDVGHPPFGHIAEDELNRLVRKHGDKEGFEGNAQSFRVVTRLEVHRTQYDGLNLTRATLNGILKYPWYRRDFAGADEKSEKFGAYRSDWRAFEHARMGTPGAHQSVEASIMDVADSIAYSVHDLDDFQRAGLIPVAQLAYDDSTFSEVIASWKRSRKPPPENLDDYIKSIRRLLKLFVSDDEEAGRGQRADNERRGAQDQERDVARAWEQRALQCTASARLIQKYVMAVQLIEPNESGHVAVIADPAAELEMRFLQRLVWHYVIENPRLATQQHGQRRMIETLFDIYHAAVQREDWNLIPAPLHREVWRISHPREPGRVESSPARVAADIIAGLTDVQAGVLFRRLTGVAPGSVVDLLDR